MRETHRNGVTIRLARGDITRLETDAIVNAANSALSGGGGVDGAIHRAGGPTIMEECRRLGRCPTGEARITTGGRLPARHVIHAVGPVWHGGGAGEAALLAAAYASSLALAKEWSLGSVAFPSISTGAYRYPLPDAARIALRTALAATDEPGSVREIIFVLYSDRDLAAYEEAFAAETLPGGA